MFVVSVAFDEIKSIIAATSSAHSPPDNIVIISGDDRMIQYKDALDILQDNANVNAVITLPVPCNDNMECLGVLRKEFDVATSKELAPGNTSPEASIAQLNDSSDDEIIPPETAADWAQRIQLLQNVDGISITKSQFRFNPYYDRRNMPGRSLGLHIDPPVKRDIRIIECESEPGTLLSSDSDFTFEASRITTTQPRYRIGRAHKDKITFWSLEKGCSVLFRQNSEYNFKIGAKPHAHALGVITADDDPVARFLYIHDLSFNA